jgi:hypothetical protein
LEEGDSVKDERNAADCRRVWIEDVGEETLLLGYEPENLDEPGPEVGRICDSRRTEVRHEPQRDPRQDDRRRAAAAPPPSRPDPGAREVW